MRAALAAQRPALESANDNRRPATEQDRWRMFIDAMRAHQNPCGVIAAKYKLLGWTFDRFADEMIAWDAALSRTEDRAVSS